MRLRRGGNKWMESTPRLSAWFTLFLGINRQCGAEHDAGSVRVSEIILPLLCTARMRHAFLKEVSDANGAKKRYN